MTSQIAARCMKQMLLAINYLHLNHVMHRDLKPENWLLGNKQDIGKAPLKLIDFGISKHFSQGVPCTTRVGTPTYVAPEVLVGKYDEKIDMWSLGVIMYLILSGRLPFCGKNVKETLKAVKKMPIDFNRTLWKKL